MIQVHPQLEEGVTGHGVLPNQQMFTSKRRAIYTRVRAMQEVFGPMRQNDHEKVSKSLRAGCGRSSREAATPSWCGAERGLSMKPMVPRRLVAPALVAWLGLGTLASEALAADALLKLGADL